MLRDAAEARSATVLGYLQRRRELLVAAAASWGLFIVRAVVGVGACGRDIRISALMRTHTRIGLGQWWQWR